MIFSKDIAKKTAELLLQINAIKLQPNDPFTWASGWKSPIYCDNRIVLVGNSVVLPFDLEKARNDGRSPINRRRV